MKLVRRIASTCALVLALGALALGAAGAGSPLPARAESDSVLRGKYLVSIMDCGGCHTPGALAGKPDHARLLAGSTIGFGLPGLGVVYPPNLTPDPETGLGRWTDEEIARAIRYGRRPDGRGLAPVMPWPSYSALTDVDAAAIVAFLRVLPPVRNAAPRPVAEGQRAPAPYLGVIRPD